MGQATDSIQSHAIWALNPNMGSGDVTIDVVDWWDVELTIPTLTDGSAAPSWISYDMGTNEIIIDTTTATTPGIYDLTIRGEARDDESNYTGKYETRTFRVVIY